MAEWVPVFSKIEDFHREVMMKMYHFCCYMSMDSIEWYISAFYIPIPNDNHQVLGCKYKDSSWNWINMWQNLVSSDNIDLNGACVTTCDPNSWDNSLQFIMWHHVMSWCDDAILQDFERFFTRFL